MMSAATPSPRPTDPRWAVALHACNDTADTTITTTAATASASPHAELEAFLQERLDNWAVESAEVISLWGRVGDMCSPDYQSQLRRAAATLQEAQRSKERQHDEASAKVRQDAVAAARVRHRDRLAAEARARAAAKAKAAERLRERQAQQKRGPSRPPQPQPPTVALANPAEGRAPSSLSRGTEASTSYTQPAPPTVARTANALSVRKLDTDAKRTTEHPVRSASAVIAAKPHKSTEKDKMSRSSSSSSSSSTLTLNSDAGHDLAEAVESAALGETFSGTFVVRRKLTTHVFSTQAPRHASMRHTPVRAVAGCPPCPTPPRPSLSTAESLSPTTATAAIGAAASPSPRKVQPAVLPPPSRRRRSSSKTTVAGTANSSLSPVDPSLPFEADEATAIFASRSRSHETATPQRRSSSRGVNATAEFISPIKDTHLAGALSSVSSAGSYLRAGDGSD